MSTIFMGSKRLAAASVPSTYEVTALAGIAVIVATKRASVAASVSDIEREILRIGGWPFGDGVSYILTLFSR